MRSLAFVCLSASLALAACEEGSPVAPVVGDGTFDPVSVDLGAVPTGETHTVSVALKNHTPNDLLVSAIRFAPDTDAFAAKKDDGSPLRGTFLPAGAHVLFSLLFAPRASGDYSTTMIVALGGLEVALPIRASGRPPEPPKVLVSPNLIAFPSVALGARASQAIVVANGGEVEARLVSIRTIEGDGAPFSILTPLGGPAVPSSTIAPGGADRVPLVLSFAPAALGTSAATLELAFDAGSPASVRVSGTAVTPGRLACDATRLDLGAVARGTADVRHVRCRADGAWALDHLGLVPGSSPLFHVVGTATVADGVSLDITFQAEGLPAVHTATVAIVATHGATTELALAAEVVAPPVSEQALSIRLTWDTSRTDLDLHLTRSGAAPFTLGEDCHFGDKNPDWGQRGRSVDDPFLDYDATAGYGPEVIDLAEFGEVTYDAWVQFYAFSASVVPPTHATVAWTVAGGAPMTSAMLLTSCGSTWHVGRVRFDVHPPALVLDGAVTDDFQGFASPRCQ